MNQYTIASIIVLILLLSGTGFALKKQLELNGEQRAQIKEQSAALELAEKLRAEAEAATLARDKELSNITATNRRLQNAISHALQNDDCARRPIPAPLDQLLRERAPKAGESLPAGDTPPRAPIAAVGG